MHKYGTIKMISLIIKQLETLKCLTVDLVPKIVIINVKSKNFNKYLIHF